MKRGAFFTGVYPNYFEEIGVTREEADARVRACFETIFRDPGKKFYHDVDENSGCLEDTGNHDARTEGMSYGMMMCVQMDEKALFDKLWCFSKRYMHLDSGNHAGYFAWTVGLDGSHNAEGPAPDGEEYFAMALFMASGRWGDGEGMYAYSWEARDILRHCLHQAELAPGGQPMWDPKNHLIKFVPETPFSDPSYHLPHFYELFALLADAQDRPFWRAAAAKSRKYVALCAHPITGLSPEYAEFDGRIRLLFGKDFEYYSDAYRVGMNIALDHAWFGGTPALSAVASRLQAFFSEQTQFGKYYAYHLDGTHFLQEAMHPTAIIATTAAVGIAGDGKYRRKWLEYFWSTPLRTGDRRYYDNCLYFFCLLILSGGYRIYYKQGSKSIPCKEE